MRFEWALHRPLAEFWLWLRCLQASKLSLIWTLQVFLLSGAFCRSSPCLVKRTSWAKSEQNLQLSDLASLRPCGLLDPSWRSLGWFDSRPVSFWEHLSLDFRSWCATCFLWSQRQKLLCLEPVFESRLSVHDADSEQHPNNALDSLLILSLFR